MARKANKNTGLAGALAAMIVDGVSAPVKGNRKKGAKPAPAPPAKKAKAPPAPKVKEPVNVSLDGRLHKSSIDKPCKTVWDLCDALVVKQGLKRKDVLAAAAKAGIAFYTARTQYQAWLTAYKAS